MNCTLLLATKEVPAAEVAQVSKQVAEKEYVESWQAFEKQEKSFGGRPVHFGEWSKCYIFYHEHQICRELCQEVALGARSFLWCDRTISSSSEKAVWKRRGQFVKVTAVQFDEKLRKVPEGWKDPEFPHDMSSIGMRNIRECEWIRAVGFGTEGIEHVPSEIRSQLISAGGILEIAGWWLQSLDWPSFLLTSKSMSLAQDGRYRLRPFDCQTDEWKIIELDDYVPCHPHRQSPGRIMTLFGGCAPDLSGVWFLALLLIPACGGGWGFRLVCLRNPHGYCEPMYPGVNKARSGLPTHLLPKP